MVARTPLENGREPARLIIVDDLALAREGLQDMLADEADLEVVG